MGATYRGEAVIHEPDGDRVTVQVQLWKEAEDAGDPSTGPVDGLRLWGGVVLFPATYDPFHLLGQLVGVEIDGARGDALLNALGEPAELVGSGPAPF